MFETKTMFLMQCRSNRYRSSKRSLFGSFRLETMNQFGAFVVILLVCFQFVPPTECSFDPFMDSDLFSINWGGPLDLNEEEVKILGDRHLVLTTSKHEKYECILPESKKTTKDSSDEYSGPSAEELLRPLFQQSVCTYRIESYWTYELCHGKHLKQYHETKEQGSQPKVMEYYLGFGNHRDSKEGDTNEGTSEQTESEKKGLPTKELDGEELPYFEVIMSDGTKCDLTDTPRKTHVFYVCHPEGRGDVYVLKESSTCEYEALVLTAYLCKHPEYRPKRTPVSEVRCHAVLGSPLKPSELINVERETKSLSRVGQDFVIRERKTHTQVETDVDSQQKVPAKMHRRPVDVTVTSKPPSSTQSPPQDNKLGAITDKQTLRNFLKGDLCLQGGASWWRHEVCFGKHVRQYHKEQGKEIASILLGSWDEDKHLNWLQENPLKRPKDPSLRKSVSLYYSNGEHCDLANKPRTCEVRLKCIFSKHSHAVILSLVEPRPCEYILTVESNLFCSVLKDATNDGLLDNLEL